MPAAIILSLILALAVVLAIRLWREDMPPDARIVTTIMMLVALGLLFWAARYAWMQVA